MNWSLTSNELASKLVEYAQGTAPALDGMVEQLNALGMSGLVKRIEVPLQPVLRAIEERGLLVDDQQLRALVCDHAPYADHAARLRRAVDRQTGRVHTHLDALGTRTGRITASEFPLHSLPRELRRAVTAGPGRVFVIADYGQFEWRIAAALSGDDLLLRLLAQPSFDLYCAVAVELSGTAQYRDQVKAGMMRFLYSRYRMQAITEFEQRLSSFLASQHPRLIEWLQQQELAGQQHQLIRTPYGRQVHLPGPSSGEDYGDRAVNYLIQATAADVFKLACLAVDRVASSQARILLPFHDALLLDCAESDVDLVASAVVASMAPSIDGIPVRLEVKTTVTRNWV